MNNEITNIEGVSGVTSNDFKTNLISWAIQYHIEHAALNSLLKLVKNAKIDPSNIPSDSRTLLKTPRQIEYHSVAPGTYSHIGLYKAIEYLLRGRTPPEKIDILVNIDGLPLSKSSGSQIWPILCSIHNMPFGVALIGVYHGYKKPANSNEFLEDFVIDAMDLTDNGFNLNGNIIPFKIIGLICDAPAKSFVLNTVGHAGYFSCTKCIQKGEYLKGRTCFPQTKCRKRTNSSFRLKLQKEHHVGTSILENIPEFDMVSNVPVEYMHLMCLGVMKKLLVNMWVYGRPPNKFRPVVIETINNRLDSIKNHIPIEFARKPRSLEEVKRWKATEFRFFLLYSGSFILNGLIDEKHFLNFLSLHISARIFSNNSPDNLFEFATSLLEYFVKSFEKLYGREFLSRNVHNLLHVSDDIKTFGPLHCYSAFPFENMLGSLKKLLRKHEKPISQILKRMKEIENNYCPSNSVCPDLLCQVPHDSGPTPDAVGWLQYKSIIFRKFKLDVNNVADSFCLLTNNTIVRVYNILGRNSKIGIYGKRFCKIENFFESPCNSSDLDIYVVSNLDNDLSLYNIENIVSKLVAFPLTDKFVVYPLLHECDQAITL
ncbi:unnamed protein product [Phaedon cochleariae]|uniref:Transposase domain-containing protein n=1 Tax=Phaedon cochleariae TaxID=80249 RepID=A0A9N9S8H0_PHACE|nr:unnamed protein product [Phaedon cochleariae]